MEHIAEVETTRTLLSMTEGVWKNVLEHVPWLEAYITEPMCGAEKVLVNLSVQHLLADSRFNDQTAFVLVYYLIDQLFEQDARINYFNRKMRDRTFGFGREFVRSGARNSRKVSRHGRANNETLGRDMVKSLESMVVVLNYCSSQVDKIREFLSCSGVLKGQHEVIFSELEVIVGRLASGWGNVFVEGVSMWIDPEIVAAAQLWKGFADGCL